MINTKYNLIGERYADALVDMVHDGRLSFEKISQDINTIKEILRNSNDLVGFLESPIVSVEDKKDVIDKVFSADIDKLMLNFLKVLVDENRIQAFNEVATQYENRLDKINNVSRVEVVSAVDVSDDVKGRLKGKLEEKMHKSVNINWQKDEAIIAGLIIKIGDNIIDTSLRHKLEDLGKTITK